MYIYICIYIYTHTDVHIQIPQGNSFISHQAQNGSGKTAAFSLAVLSSIELEVLVPAVVNFVRL